MVRPQSGVASVNSFGVNYSDSWGKTGRQDKVTLQASYFFNRTTTKNYSTIDKWYETPSPIDTLHTDGYSEQYERQPPPQCPSRMAYFGEPVTYVAHGTQFPELRSLQHDLWPPVGRERSRVVDNFSDGDRTGVQSEPVSSPIARSWAKMPHADALTAACAIGTTEEIPDSYSNQARGIDPDLIVVPTDTLLLRYQRAHSPSFSYNLRGDVTYTEPVSQYAAVEPAIPCGL